MDDLSSFPLIFFLIDVVLLSFSFSFFSSFTLTVGRVSDILQRQGSREDVLAYRDRWATFL